MTDDDPFLSELTRVLAGDEPLQGALGATVAKLGCDSGTLHLLGADGQLHLEAATAGLPEPVLATIRTIPVGKGMAGLAVERAEPVTACNLQTDDSGDVRPGAKATGLQGAIVVPVLDARDRPVGSLGVANRAERTFTAGEIALLTAVGRAIGARRES